MKPWEGDWWPTTAKLKKGRRRRTGEFKVYLKGKQIDAVFYNRSNPISAEAVRRSLINHDGYDPGIKVKAVWGKV